MGVGLGCVCYWGVAACCSVCAAWLREPQLTAVVGVTAGRWRSKIQTVLRHRNLCEPGPAPTSAEHTQPQTTAVGQQLHISHITATSPR